jgi:hypothetical protein
MIEYIQLAFTLPASTYGLGEVMCGDPHKPAACEVGAVTASGDQFDPDALTVAIPLPTNRRMRPAVICILNPSTGKSAWVKVNDKSNPRWIGQRGFDITPATYQALTGKPARPWSSIEQVKEC